MSMYYDWNGIPMARAAWARKIEDAAYVRVLETTLSGGKWVSTVWLGLDHRFDGKGPPLIFETMVFPGEGEWAGLDVCRYSTLAEAEAGHASMVAKWQVKRSP